MAGRFTVRARLSLFEAYPDGPPLIDVGAYLPSGRSAPPT